MLISHCTEHAPGVVAVELSADGIHWTADNVLYTYIDVTTPKCAITVPSPIASTLVNRNTLRLGSGYECVHINDPSLNFHC
jgi:glycine cleavage system H lipoate-binding protein